MTFSSDTRSAGHARQGGFFSRLLGHYSRLQARRANRAVLMELCSHHDYLLADIGLTRRDVENALENLSEEDMMLALKRMRQNPLRPTKL